MDDNEDDYDDKENQVKFKVIQLDGKELFQCEGCEKTSISKQGIKHHITRSHKAAQNTTQKKRKERTPEKDPENKKNKTSEPDADYSFNFADFEEFEASTQKDVGILEDFSHKYSQGMEGQNLSEQTLAAIEAIAKTDASFSTVDKEVRTEGLENVGDPINTALETIAVMKKENEALTNLLDNRGKEVEVKNDMIKVLQAEKNSLEDEVKSKEEVIVNQNQRIMDLEVKQIDLKAKYMRMGKICESMKVTIKETKSKPATINEESVNKVKKVQMQLVNLSKELEEEKRKTRSLEKALSEESKLKNNFEVENSRNVGMVQIMKEMMEKGQSHSRGMEKRKEKCRDFEKSGMCNRGERCAFLHPSTRCQSFLTTGCSNRHSGTT